MGFNKAYWLQQTTPSSSTTSTPSAPAPSAPPPAPITPEERERQERIARNKGYADAFWADIEARSGMEGIDPSGANLASLVRSGQWTGFGDEGNAYDFLTMPVLRDAPMARGQYAGRLYRDVLRDDPNALARGLIGLMGPEGGSLRPFMNAQDMTPEEWGQVFQGLDPNTAKYVSDYLGRELGFRIDKAQETDLLDYAEQLVNPITLGLLFAGLPGTAGLTGAASGTSLLGQIGSSFSGLTGGMLSPATASRLVGPGLSILGGGDPAQALQSFGLNQGIGMLGEAVTPIVNSLADSFNFDPDALLAAGGEGGERLREADVFADLDLGNSLTESDVFSPTVEPEFAPSDLVFDPAMVEQNLIGDIDFGALAPSMESPDAPAEPTFSQEEVEGYLRAANTLYEMLGAPDGAPQRSEGQTDEQYAQDLAAYMNLDAQAMAEMGLQPGSPEYTNYILQQADSIVSQALQGVDVNADDIMSQLRDKTEEEMVALQRALFVRGTLQQMMGAGEYVDPVTGTAQAVVGPGMFNPNVAAYQRGLAGSFQNISRSDDPLADINSLLGRRADLFGMQERADERFERAKMEDDIRRRRGMLSL